MGDAFLIQNIKQEILGEIISNGLLVHWNMSDTNSYPGSGTTLFDISGNNINATLFNGVTFDTDGGGSLDTNTGNRYIATNTTPTQLQGNPNFTISMWIKRNGNYTLNNGPWGFGGNATNQGINSWWSNNFHQITVDVWSAGTFTTNVSYDLNQWHFVTWQKIAGSMIRSNNIIWKNLTSYTGNQLSIIRGETGVPNINSEGIVLAKISKTFQTTSTNFKFGQVLIYNRILTAQEIEENFNVTKSRFGL